MSKWSRHTEDRVKTAVTIKRFGESDKSLLELIREQK